MAKKTPVDKLSEAISSIVSDHGEGIRKNLASITKKMGQKGASALRQQSKETFDEHTGKYAKGWKYEFRETKRYSKTTIYNEQYGMPHLLENDHVVKNGTQRIVGHYHGRKHIEPIANELTERYEKEVIEKL